MRLNQEVYIENKFVFLDSVEFGDQVRYAE